MIPRRTLREMAVSVALVLVLAYAAVAALAFFFGERLIFQPQPASYDRRAETLLLPVGRDSVAVRWLPNPRARFAILYSHGNAEDLGDLEPLLVRMRDAGFSVLSYDYPGYGLSGGRPSERGAYRAHEAAYRHLTGELGISPDRVILHGRSLGGGVASELAARCPAAGLILESTFTSTLRVVAPRVFPFDRFATAPRLARIEAPILVIHGTGDQVIPFAHGQMLHRMARNRVDPLWISGAGHDDVPLVGGEMYFEALRRFSAGLPRDTPRQSCESPSQQ
jgi:abhydrolase domain-containing protein 17